jgi:hypothetical protein
VFQLALYLGILVAAGLVIVLVVMATRDLARRFRSN